MTSRLVKRTRAPRTVGAGARDQAKGRVAFSTYSTVPKLEMTLTDYQEMSEQRLSLLKWLENQDSAIDLRAELQSKLRQKNLYSDENRDHISHFMLVLGLCRDKERREWLIRYERRLFELKWDMASAEQRRQIKCELVETDCVEELDKAACIDKEKLSGQYPIPNLVHGMMGVGEEKLFPIYKVHFTEVPELVSSMSVFIQGGYAYVPREKFKLYLSGKFRAQLSHRIAKAQKRLPKLAKGPGARLLPIVRKISTLTRGPVYNSSNSETQLRARDVPKAVHHFPPCMRVMEQQMRRDSHLKHKGRLTYGKFLKGCGMTCDDQIDYYRMNFTKKMSSEKFSKEYRYGIRHHYGMEGKKKNYPALGCQSIIMDGVGAGEYHGCPFKHFDKSNLSNLLRMLRVPEKDHAALHERAQGGHFNLACRDYFGLINRNRLKKNGTEIEDIDCTWSHPNAFYNASIKLDTPAATDQGATTAG